MRATGRRHQFFAVDNIFMPTKRTTTKKPKQKKLSLSARLKMHAGQRKTHAIAKPKSKAKAIRPAKLKKKAPVLPPVAHANPDLLRKHDANPIIEPRARNYWEMKATFNPAAVYADRRVHLLYRAIGGDDISVLGYAASSDGMSIDERSEEPAFTPIVKKKTPEEIVAAKVEAPAYSSGGGWNGGCEDPRLTMIDDRIYLMYTAFDGWGSIRIALASIGTDDFLARRWQWKNPMLLSPPGQIHKNWLLFPKRLMENLPYCTGLRRPS